MGARAAEGTVSVTETWSVTFRYSGNATATTVRGTESGTLTIRDGRYTLINNSSFDLSPFSSGQFERNITVVGSRYSIAGDRIILGFGGGAQFYALVRLSFFLVRVPLPDGEVPSNLQSFVSYDTSGTSLSALSASGSYVAVGGFTMSASSTSSLGGTAGALPLIISGPVGTTVTAGGAATFGVTVVSQTPLGYQWQKNGANIPGATGSSLVFSGAQASDAGTYQVVVSNSTGSVTSSPALLTVLASPLPTIAAQPTSRTVVAGAGTTFSVTPAGSPPFTYQWRKNGAVIPGATGANYAITNVQGGDAGAYTVVVSNAAGSVTSDAATLTLTPASTAPIITSQPRTIAVRSGSTVALAVAASGATPFSYQWRKNGVNVAGATGATLVLNAVTAADAATYTVAVANSLGTTLSGSAAVTVTTASAALAPSRLSNLSVRSVAGTGGATLIVGFVVGGAGTAGTKPLLIRGIGPALAPFGVTGVLADPRLSLFSGTTVLATNDDWKGDAQIAAVSAQVGAFALAPANGRDAALYRATQAAGAFSVQLTGAGTTTGVALAELYDATAAVAFSTATPRLINVSARAQVGVGGDILIAGFVIDGPTAQTVMVRGIGPALTAFGVPGTLSDPKLELFQGTTKVAENDDWGGAPAVAEIAGRAGAFALPSATSRDAVQLITLPPGAYTAQVSGSAGTTGVALVEVYEIDAPSGAPPPGPLAPAFELFATEFTSPARLYLVAPSTGATTSAGATGFLPGLEFRRNGTLYGASNSLNLVSPVDGSVTLIGTLPELLVSIAFSPDDALYGVNNDGTRLYRIDPTTGRSLGNVTLSGTTHVTGAPFEGEINGIAFSADGTLYGIGFSLYAINPATGVATRITPLGRQVSGDLFQDLDMGPDGLLRGVTFGTPGSPSNLYVLDVRTGIGQLVGSMGASIAGLASRVP